MLLQVLKQADQELMKEKKIVPQNVAEMAIIEE